MTAAATLALALALGGTAVPASPTPASSLTFGDLTATLICRVWTHGIHAKRGFVCLDGAIALGACLTQRGEVRDFITGTWDGQCLTLEGCGVDQVVCV